MRRKAVSLLSGGLDSLIATKIIVEQGIKVEALHFTSPFCTCSKGNKGCGIQAVRSAKELGIEVNVRTKGLEYLEIVKKPRHGYGRAMNPCIDCRIFMLKHARQFMDEIGASFIITGEVLGQRPMSQRTDTLRLIERESSLEGLIVRPLSAGIFRQPSLNRRASSTGKSSWELPADQERGNMNLSIPMASPNSVAPVEDASSPIPFLPEN